MQQQTQELTALERAKLHAISRSNDDLPKQEQPTRPTNQRDPSNRPPNLSELDSYDRVRPIDTSDFKVLDEHGFALKAFTFFRDGEVPEAIVAKYKDLALAMRKAGWTYRWNCDTTCDMSNLFKSICDKQEVYVPWKNYTNLPDDYRFAQILPPEGIEVFNIAKTFTDVLDTQKYFEGMKPARRNFRARDTTIMLGDDLRKPVQFLFIYHENQGETAKDSKGGYYKYSWTNFVMNIAIQYSDSIRVINLARDDAEKRVIELMEIY